MRVATFFDNVVILKKPAAAWWVQEQFDRNQSGNFRNRVYWARAS
jgi:hypothetical protein